MKKIVFTAPKDAIILTSCLFSTMPIKKIGVDKYSLSTMTSLVDKELIKRNGGKIKELVN